MGLPDGPDLAEPPHLRIGFECLQRRLDLGGVMAVVVDHDTLFAVFDDVEALLDPLVAFQVFPDRLDLFAFVQRRQDRQGSVHGDMLSQPEDIEHAILFEPESGMGLAVDEHILQIPDIPAGIELHALHFQFREKGVLGVDHPHLRQRQKIGIGPVEPLQIVLVVLHMLWLHVGHQSQIGVAVEKTGVALVRFEDYVVVGGGADVGVEGFGDGADEGVGFGQQFGEHRRRGALAVGPSDGVDALVSQDELQRLFTGVEGNPQLPGADIFGVVLSYRRRVDHHVGPFHRVAVVGNRDLRAEFQRQLVGDFALTDIRPADLVPLARHELGQRRNADAADADEMDFHFFRVSSSLSAFSSTSFFSCRNPSTEGLKLVRKKP